MNQELPRRSFFSALALAPLAWLGLRKKPDDQATITVSESNRRVKRWFITAQYHSKARVYWQERALAAEKELQEAQAVIDEACCLLEASRPCKTTYQADALMVLREKNSSTTTRIIKRKTACVHYRFAGEIEPMPYDLDE